MWKTRSYEPELLDGQEYTKDELFRNLRELYWVNRWLGGHNGSVWLTRKCLQSGFLPDSVVDIGCGGGDTLEVLQKKFVGLMPRANWIGTDLNPLCLDYAMANHPGSGIQYWQSDFREIPPSGRVLFHASLFFHHFREDEIASFIRTIHSQGHGLLINDLERHFLAWAGIRLIAAYPGLSRLFRNDAPLSVRRGFTTDEWTQCIDNSGVRNHYLIRKAFGFRHLILILPPDYGKS
jgi:SAM-dependent methyltransferase